MGNYTQYQWQILRRVSNNAKITFFNYSQNYKKTSNSIWVNFLQPCRIYSHKSSQSADLHRSIRLIRRLKEKHLHVCVDDSAVWRLCECSILVLVLNDPTNGFCYFFIFDRYVSRSLTEDSDCESTQPMKGLNWKPLMKYFYYFYYL